MAIPNTQARTAYALQPGEGRLLDTLRVRILATEALAGALMAGEVVNPGPGGAALHTHHGHDELYLVLEGRYRFKLEDAEHEGGPGMFVYAPRGTCHTFASVGPEKGRLFFITLPSLEGFLERLNALPEGDNTRAEAAAIFRAFDSEINGPSLI